MNIEVLPEHIIDQIKAGEVLERPAALLKELIENSIDAHSTEINIHIIDNGLTLLSIEDNGTGISFTNLPKAFLRHATSKLKRFEDLYSLHSYGFRGEALASLAASARVTCVSQPENLSLPGGKLIINGGHEELLTAQTNTKAGTSLFIKDLFYNTPARLKFIKSKTSEKIQLKKILHSFILSHPDIQFSTKWDDKEKDFFKKYLPNEFAKRVENIFPPNSKVYSAEENYQNYNVKIYFTHEASRNNIHKNQYLFVNTRYFQDKTLHQSIIRNLESLWSYGESGHYVLLITTPTDSIDVNVHPNKTQIKFLDGDIVYSLLVTAIKTALKKTELPNSIPTTKVLPLLTGDVSQFQNLQLSTPSYNQLSTGHEEEQAISLIDNSFGFYKSDSQYYLINLKKLTDEVICNLIEKCLQNDEFISPLLVSEPIKVKSKNIDRSFEQLKKIGFEFDRLSDEVIILRTIPKLLPRAILNYTAESLVNYFQNNQQVFDQKNFNTILSKNSETNINFNVPLVKNLISLSDTKNNEHTIKLNKFNLGSFFK